MLHKRKIIKLYANLLNVIWTKQKSWGYPKEKKNGKHCGGS